MQVVPSIIASPGLADAAPAVPTRRSARSARILRTARHLTFAQLAARARFMLLRRLYALAPERPIESARRAAAGSAAMRPLPTLARELIAAEDAATVRARAAEVAAGRFTFLGRTVDFSAGIRWQDPDASPLWSFNLQYLGGLLDLALADRPADAARLLGAWTAAYGARWDPVAWHPYPTSLRLTNLCFAAMHCGAFDALGPDAGRAAASHAAYLLRHLEHDLRGNHLLENACALLVASTCLQGPLARRCGAVARALFSAEIPEQVRADGSHFELSPMYHALVLQRCLQVLALLDRDEALARDVLAPAVTRMATFLSGIVCPDGDIPLLGDAARGFAPPPAALLVLAERLTGVHPQAPLPGVCSFDSAGLHVLRSSRTWSIFDAGPVCAEYLPGHGQADSLTVEVWCDGACIVGDPGVHEYTGPERAWGRSSRAHSTVTVDDQDTSEVYGSFRVGGRAQVTDVIREPRGVTATLEPYGVAARFIRRVVLARAPATGIAIFDQATVPAGRAARARLHLHPDVRLVGGLAADQCSLTARSAAGTVRITSQHPMRLEAGRASRQYGRIEPTTILVQELRPAPPDYPAVCATFSIEPLAPS